jgi:hypothetical protein
MNIIEKYGGIHEDENKNITYRFINSVNLL